MGDDTVLYKLTGLTGFEVECGGGDKIRVVFAMIAEDKSNIAWYMFSSTPSAKAQKECASTDVWIIDDPFGFRTDVGRLIPHTFHKKIGLDGLADADKGTVATLSFDAQAGGRLMGCRISDLKTKAGEIVTFPFGMQQDDMPPRAGQDIKGRVYFLEMGPFDEKTFSQGPQGKASQVKISGPVL